MGLLDLVRFEAYSSMQNFVDFYRAHKSNGGLTWQKKDPKKMSEAESQQAASGSVASLQEEVLKSIALLKAEVQSVREVIGEVRDLQTNTTRETVFVRRQAQNETPLTTSFTSAKFIATKLDFAPQSYGKVRRY